MASWVESLDLPLSSGEEERAGTQLLLTFEGGEAHIVLENNATTRDFLSMLPASLLFQEYAGCEKISYLAEEVSTAGAPERYDPRVGDVALYAPWGILPSFMATPTAPPAWCPWGASPPALNFYPAWKANLRCKFPYLSERHNALAQ